MPSSSAPTAAGTAPSRAASRARSTRSCGARAARLARDSTPSRRPARCSTSAPATASLLDALAAAGREAVGLERHSTRANVREAEVTELDRPLRRGRLLALARAPARTGCRGRRTPRGCSPQGGVLVVAVPNADSLQARIFGERWLALDLPRHLVHLPAARWSAAWRRRAGRGARQPLARRAGRCSAGCTASSARSRAARPVRRDPPSRRPPGPARPRAGERGRSPRRSCSCPSPRSSLCGIETALRSAAAPSTSRPRCPPPVSPSRQGRSSSCPRATPRDARADRQRRSRATWVDEVILVDDKSSDDTVELARRLPTPRDLAPAQRRLRRQPEDLLPRGAPARTPTSW